MEILKFLSYEFFILFTKQNFKLYTNHLLRTIIYVINVLVVLQVINNFIVCHAEAIHSPPA